MHDWMQANDVAWQVYFEDLGEHRLHNNSEFEDAAAKFKRLFSR